jgi:hypothetical protein
VRLVAVEPDQSNRAGAAHNPGLVHPFGPRYVRHDRAATATATVTAHYAVAYAAMRAVEAVTQAAAQPATLVVVRASLGRRRPVGAPRTEGIGGSAGPPRRGLGPGDRRGDDASFRVDRWSTRIAAEHHRRATGSGSTASPILQCPRRHASHAVGLQRSADDDQAKTCGLPSTMWSTAQSKPAIVQPSVAKGRRRCRSWRSLSRRS